MAVYCLVEVGAKWFKIGRAACPVSRLNGLAQRFDLDKSFVLLPLPGISDQLLESTLHVIFNDYRMHKEWVSEGHTEWFAGSILSEFKSFLTSGEVLRWGCNPIVPMSDRLLIMAWDDQRMIRQFESASDNKGLAIYLRVMEGRLKALAARAEGQCAGEYRRSALNQALSCGHLAWNGKVPAEQVLPCRTCGGNLELVRSQERGPFMSQPVGYRGPRGSEWGGAELDVNRVAWPEVE